MGKVFVVQQPLRKTMSGALTAAFDVTPALEFGDLELLLDSGVVIGIAMMPMVRVFHQKLKNFCDDDYILPAGDVAAMGIAIAIAAQHNSGRVAVLRWDRIQRKYIALRIDLTHA